MNPQSESPPELCVVVPVFNEEECIGAVLREWHAAISAVVENFRFLVVNDGSRDNTPALLDGLAADLPGMQILHKLNSGHGKSCRTGYEAACQSGCAWVLQIDSDGQCDPAYFESFWQEKSAFDCVFGSRVKRDDGLVRQLISLGCTLAVACIGRVGCGDANVPYRLVRSRVLKKALPRIPMDFELQNIALTVVLKRDKSLRWKRIPIRFPVRRGGVNSLNAGRAMRLGWSMLGGLRQLHRSPEPCANVVTKNPQEH